jgi:hypothetical protein
MMITSDGFACRTGAGNSKLAPAAVLPDYG